MCVFFNCFRLNCLYKFKYVRLCHLLIINIIVFFNETENTIELCMIREPGKRKQ